MTPEQTALVLAIPIIIGLVNLCKRLFPAVTGRIWLAISLFLGIVTSVLGSLAAGMPKDMAGWLLVIYAGLIYGLATSKAHDTAQETKIE